MEKTLYYEDAIDKILSLDFKTVDIGNLRVKEIDLRGDYESTPV